jgi:hypothetical protein
MACARRCQREHHIAYHLGYRPAGLAETLRFGLLLHLGLNAWLRSKADRLADALQVLELAEADEFDRAKATALMVGYDTRWLADADLYEVLGIEAEFLAPLRNPVTGMPSRTWQLGGKLDGLVREIATGRLGVLEHKSSTEDVGVGTDYWRRLRMDPQVSNYYAGGEVLLGRPVDFCIYDVVKKPLQRPSAIPLVDEAGAKIVLDASGQRVRTKDGKKWRETADAAAGYVLQSRPETATEYRNRLVGVIGENPAAFYARGEVVRLGGEVDDAIFDAWQLAQQLHEANKIGRWPRNPNSCLRYGRSCAFLPVCSGEGSLDDTTQFRKLDDVHPELNGAAEAA